MSGTEKKFPAANVVIAFERLLDNSRVTPAISGSTAGDNESVLVAINKPEDTSQNELNVRAALVIARDILDAMDPEAQILPYSTSAGEAGISLSRGQLKKLHEGMVDQVLQARYKE